MFAYCKKHDDQEVKDFDKVEWVSQDWSQFYPDISGEGLPPEHPTP
jgi:hypothetical protein